MLRPFRLTLVSIISLLFAGPCSAAGIIGAGSGSNGGSMTGTTNESSQGVKTGASNGSEAVPSKQDHTGIGTGDNAVLNAPRETVPGTTSPSQPSNLSGQSAQP